MSMDDVEDLEARELDLPDAPHLVVDVVPVELTLEPDVSEDAVALPLANVEGLAVARVDEPIDVSLQTGCDLGRELFGTGVTATCPVS
jgi:hypothetical protein